MSTTELPEGAVTSPCCSVQSYVLSQTRAAAPKRDYFTIYHHSLQTPASACQTDARVSEPIIFLAETRWHAVACMAATAPATSQISFTSRQTLPEGGAPGGHTPPQQLLTGCCITGPYAESELTVRMADSKTLAAYLSNHSGRDGITGQSPSW